MVKIFPPSVSKVGIIGAAPNKTQSAAAQHSQSTGCATTQEKNLKFPTPTMDGGRFGGQMLLLTSGTRGLLVMCGGGNIVDFVICFLIGYLVLYKGGPLGSGQHDGGRQNEKQGKTQYVAIYSSGSRAICRTTFSNQAN